MNTWKTVKVGELGKIVTGKTPKTSISENYGGSIPFLTPSDDMSVKYVDKTIKTLTERGLSEVKNAILPPNTVCVSCIGSDLGKVVITTQNTVTNQQINSIIVDTTQFDVSFVYYAMLVLGKELNFISKTSTAVPIVNKSSFSSYEIKCPTLEQQKKISSILSAMDSKIENNQKINDNLQQQIDAIFAEFFLSNVDRSVLTVADVSIKVTDGVHNTVKDDPTGEYYLLSCKNIKGGLLTIGNSERRINKETFVKLRKRTKLEKGDILLSSVGTVGELLLLKEIPYNYEFQRSVAMIKPNPAFVSSEYLYQALRAKKNEIIHAAHGAVQQCLFISDISDFQIPVPTKSELEKFNSLVVPMFSQIQLNESENKRLVAIRDALLPKLMSGKINVSNIDI